MRFAERVNLADEPDFALAHMQVSPSACRISANGADHKVEAQTMAVLVALVRAEGVTVTREELVAACWRSRVVSDDAIARTIAKVRALARNTDPPAFTLETVPKVGYRLSPAATVNPAGVSASQHAERAESMRSRAATPFAGLAALALLLLLGAGNFQPWALSHEQAVDAAIPRPVRSVDVTDALLNLDETRLLTYVRGGWNPNWHLDSEGNAALHTLMLACERNPTHDRIGVVRVARFLVDAGANPSAANKWGDTPLTIARSRRYCGPNHPVVAYLRSLPAHSESVLSAR